LSIHPPVRNSCSQQLNVGRINSVIDRFGNYHSPRTKLHCHLLLSYRMRGFLPTRCLCTHSNNNASSQGLHETEDKSVNQSISFSYLFWYFHMSVPTAPTVAPLLYTAFCFHVIIVNFETPVSVVGMTARCGLNGPELEPQCGQDISLRGRNVG
jgi:hypothetical protein